LSEAAFGDFMRGLDHVVQVVDCFQDAQHYYVVTRFAEGGDLAEWLHKHKDDESFTEEQARQLIHGIAKGLAGLHKRGLAMQDVSLENVLLQILPESGILEPQICDAGQAVMLKTSSQDIDVDHELPVPFRGFVARSCRPPELALQTEYLATQVDAWGLGCVAFQLLTKSAALPSADAAWELSWEPDDIAALLRQRGSSGVAAEFVADLLHPDPRQRCSVTAVLKHPWLAGVKSDDCVCSYQSLENSGKEQLGIDDRSQGGEAFQSSFEEQLEQLLQLQKMQQLQQEQQMQLQREIANAAAAAAAAAARIETFPIA
jgi:serine/threonine protein kinase